MTAPTVSVLMPAYNAEAYVADAVASILRQTFVDLELLVVDDGSTDTTQRILAQFDDHRLTVITLPHNGGYTKALNIAIEHARGEILVRQDADDLSRPGRIAAQVARLRSDERLAIVGSDIEVIDDAGAPIRIDRQPRSDAEIRVRALFQNPFAHSSVAFRRRDIATLGHAYDPSLEPSEDYGLWCDLLTLGNGANIPKALVAYRIHPGQVSSTRAQRQERAASIVARRNLATLGIEADDAELSAARVLTQGFPRHLSLEERAGARLLLKALHQLRGRRSERSIHRECRRVARRLAAAAPRSILTDRALIANVTRLDPLAPVAAIRNAVVR